MNIKPVKGHRPRITKVSKKFIERLKAIPNDNGEYVFNYVSLRSGFQKARKNAVRKLGNPRLGKITFTTFRHWKGTMEYHKTKDILHIKEMLGHRDINTTLIYTQLVSFESDDYHSATAKTTEETEQLVEAGFEYVCTTPQDVMVFRKHK